jgi:tripartite-type tricarboxylate transporter receptor subunit TctC
MLTRRRMVALSAATLAHPLMTGGVRAQGWPSRFVRLVVPFAPGGANEAFARNLAARLSEIWGQQVVIENKPGAGGNIGAEAAARSEPDGSTCYRPARTRWRPLTPRWATIWSPTSRRSP